MKELFKKLITHIKTLWGKWTLVQRIILVGIAVAVIGGIIALFSLSASPSLVPVIDYPIADIAARENIVLRINQEGVRASVNSAGLIQVADENTARRMRSILIREDLIPRGIDPWRVFDTERWSITDMERNVNLQRAQTQLIIDHIRAIDDIDNVNVSIGFPKTELFVVDQKPYTASVIITPKPGSDITANRKKIEGIQKIIKLAITGLKDENIVITDQSGMVLNDFAEMANLDWLNMREREAKFLMSQETKYRALVLQALQQTFTTDRVRDLNIKLEIDFSKKSVETEEHFPIEVNPQTPGLPYPDREVQMTVERSKSYSDTNWTGSGIYPDGPPGVEGHMPPSYRDMDNLYGTMNQKTEVTNYEINRRRIAEERSPQIDRVTVAVNIDGTWKIKYDEKGNPIVGIDNTIERDYIPVSAEVLSDVQSLIQDAIGYNAAKGDSVTVRNIQFDRRSEFAEEDAAHFRKKRIQLTIIIALSGLTFLLIAFIIFRVVAREMERRRRLAEEERLRREQLLRESAMAEAEKEGLDVSISVEERSRMELMESVINMAKEHPEDCAQLIRTWLLEE